MRFLFLIVLVANLVVLAYGQGVLGTPPSEQGREPRKLMTERNQHAVTVQSPLQTRINP